MRADDPFHADERALQERMGVREQARQRGAVMIRPFMPDTGTRTLGMLGVTPSATSWSELHPGTLAPGTKLGETTALFPRIEHSVEELRHMAANSDEGQSTPAPSTSAPSTSEPRTPEPSTQNPGPRTQDPEPAPRTQNAEPRT